MRVLNIIQGVYVDIENSFEYREYKLKVDQASSLRISLEEIEKEQLPALKKSLYNACCDAGHGYGEERRVNGWESHMVKEMSYCGQGDVIDAGHEVVYFSKKCKYCDHVNVRKAEITYS